MARPLRIEYRGALYHVTSRGGRQDAIFEDDQDRAIFLKGGGEVVSRYRWRPLQSDSRHFNRRVPGSHDLGNPDFHRERRRHLRVVLATSAAFVGQMTINAFC